MANVNVQVGYVPRAGKKAGKAGTATAVDDTIVAAVRAQILRQDPADLQQMRQKQVDVDNKVRNGTIAAPTLVDFPYKSQPLS